jgi:colanic acid biosynthesis protein WcaH
VVNSNRELLYLMRENQPAKGLWWVPGGRLLNGETFREAALRILKQETGLQGNITAVSAEFNEELWPTTGYTAADLHNYDPKTACVHYWTTVVRIQLDGGADTKLDAQSSAAQWCKDPPDHHPYLLRYFEMIKNVQK